MAYLTLLSSDARTVLEVKTQWTEDRTNIPNNEYIKRLCPALETVSTFLGIDLEEAKTTFSVVKNAKGVRVYQPYVGNRAGVAGIVWGQSFKPLADIPSASIASEGEKEKEVSFLVIEVEANGDFDDYRFPLMLVKDLVVDSKTLRKALKAGTLQDYLSKGFEKSVKLNTVSPGDYQVTAVRENVYQGEVNFDIMVETVGWVKANAKVKRRISNDNLDVSLTSPATLTVHPWDGKKTNSGYDIISVDFVTAHEESLPAFTF